MDKQAGLHFVQLVQPPAAFEQAYSLVPLAPFFIIYGKVVLTIDRFNLYSDNLKSANEKLFLQALRTLKFHKTK